MKRPIVRTERGWAIPWPWTLVPIMLIGAGIRSIAHALLEAVR